MKETVKKSISAGLIISIVSYCNVVCGDKYVGAALFAFGLIIICRYSQNLFTGMAGYVQKSTLKNFLTAAAVNCVTAFLAGVLASFNPAARERCTEICAGKISNGLPWLFVSAVFCGVLIFLGVDFFKKTDSFLGIVFAIPIFVLCGFDHTVADMFYYGASMTFSANHIIILPVIILGNIAGSQMIRLLITNKK